MDLGSHSREEIISLKLYSTTENSAPIYVRSPFFRVYGSIFSESKSYPCVPGDSRVVQGEKALTILKTPSVWFSKVKKNTTTADSIRRSWSDHRTSSLRTYTRLHFLINSMVVVVNS